MKVCIGKFDNPSVIFCNQADRFSNFNRTFGVDGFGWIAIVSYVS